MYRQAILQCVHALEAVEVFLDKTEQHAKQQNIDVNMLINERLAPDMKPFIYQVQSACDYAKGGAAWLTGQTPPRHEDNERTVQDIRARIHKTVTFVESVKSDSYERASEREVKLSWAPGKFLSGQDYLLQMIIPNVYFHISMAYAILRKSGVDVGKMDFLGPINFVDAR